MNLADAQQILGLDPQGHYIDEEIKKAYKRKAYETHPDRNNGNSDQFLKVQEAYNTLTGKRGPGGDPQFSPFGFGDIFDFMNQQFHSGMGVKQSRMPPEHDSDIPLTLNLSVEEIRQGKELKVEYKKSKPCSKCNGIGGDQKIKCTSCNGSGMVQRVQQAGNTRYVWSSPCNDCGGIGESVKNPCSVCGATGFVIYSETLRFEIKEKK